MREQTFREAFQLLHGQDSLGIWLEFQKDPNVVLNLSELRQRFVAHVNAHRVPTESAHLLAAELAIAYASATGAEGPASELLPGAREILFLDSDAPLARQQMSEIQRNPLRRRKIAAVVAPEATINALGLQFANLTDLDVLAIEKHPDVISLLGGVKSLDLRHPDQMPFVRFRITKAQLALLPVHFFSPDLSASGANREMLETILARIVLDFGPLQLRGKSQIIHLEAARAALTQA